jgi:hypothetical protein
MNVTRSQWILVATACLIVAASSAQSGADLPPGADANSWVPISDSAGILLTNVPTLPRVPGMPDEILRLREGTGVLMVKRGGAWMRVDLEFPQARLHPLN